MKAGALATTHKGVFYGWWIALASAVIGAMGSGFYFYGFTTFFLPISSELNLSRTATSAVFSLARVEGGIEGPIAGWAIDRFGARKLLVLGIILFGGGYIAMRWMNSYVSFVILYAAVISIGYNCGFSHAMYALVNKWFSRLRSRATGLVNMAFGIGGAAIIPLLAWLIINYGWRMAVFITGIVTLVIGLPLCLVIRNVPEDKGLLPDGDVAGPGPTVGGAGRVGGEVSFTVKEALKTLPFWVLCCAFILRQFVVGGIWVHMLPMLVFKGLDEQGAANAIGLLLIFSIPSRLVFGWLGDYHPKRYLLAICCLIETTALVIALTSTQLWQVYLFVIVFALGYGVAPLQAAIVGDYFGRKYFATIRGIVNMFTAIGIIAGPVYAGYIFDKTQSYQIAFVTFIGSYFLAMLVFALSKRPKLPAGAVGTTGP